MDNGTAKRERFQAIYGGNAYVASYFHTLMDTKHSKSIKIDATLSKEALMESAAEIALWIGSRDSWDRFQAGPLEQWKHYRRPLTIYDTHPGITAREAAKFSNGSRQLFQRRLAIETKFTPHADGHDNEQHIRDQGDAWVQDLENETAFLFHQTRNVRVHNKIWNLVQPAPWLAGIAAVALITHIQPGLAARADAPAVLITLLIAVIAQQAVGEIKRLRAKDKAKNLADNYRARARLKSQAFGASVAKRYLELLTRLKETVQRAANAEALEYVRDDPNAANEMQRRWLEVAMYDAARIEANRTWMELACDLNTELFKNAYTEGNYKDHLFGQGFPIRSIPRKCIGYVWRGGLAIGAVAVGWYAGLPDLFVHPCFNLVSESLYAATAGFASSLLIGSIRSSWFSKYLSEPVDWGFHKEQLQTAADQLGGEEPEILQARLLMELSSLKAAWQQRNDDRNSGKR